MADGSSFREFLEDVHVELLAWMHKLNVETGVVNLAAGETWTAADLEVKRTLAAQDCELRTPHWCREARQLIAARRLALRALPKAVDHESGVAVCHPWQSVANVV